MSAAELMAAALSDVMADSTIPLSPQSEILGCAVSVVLENATGQSLEGLAANVAASVVTTMATEAVTSMVGEVAGEIPLIGTIIAWASFVVDDIMAGDRLKELEGKHFFALCERVQQFFRPVPTGADGNRTPADIFGLYDASDAAVLAGIWRPNSGAYPVGAVEDPTVVDMNGVKEGIGLQPRPMLGTALIIVTEGEVPFGGFYVPTKAGGLRSRTYDQMTAAARIFYNVQTFGVPAKRRAQFKKLRLAIEAQRKPTPRGSTDGGVSLWPLYLDMLRSEYKAAHLNYDFVHTLIRAGTRCDPALPTVQILDLIRRWELTQEPWYLAGVAAQAKAVADAEAVVGGLLDRIRRVSLLAAALARRPRLGPISLDRLTRVQLLASALRHRPRLGPIDLSD